jgi:hypothetical protein
MTFLNDQNNTSNHHLLLLLKQNGNNIKLLKEKIELFRKETILNNEINKKTRDILASLNINNSHNDKTSSNDKRPLYTYSKSNCFHLSKIKHNNHSMSYNTNNTSYKQNRYINDYVNHRSYWQPIWMFTDNPIYEFGNDLHKKKKLYFVFFS